MEKQEEYNDVKESCAKKAPIIEHKGINTVVFPLGSVNTMPIIDNCVVSDAF